VEAVDGSKQHWPSGAINIVDDSLARATEWLPVCAGELSAECPTLEITSLDQSRPVSNAYARSLEWNPKHSTEGSMSFSERRGNPADGRPCEYVA
jgi:hypothetical protein